MLSPSSSATMDGEGMSSRKRRVLPAEDRVDAAAGHMAEASLLFRVMSFIHSTIEMDRE